MRKFSAKADPFVRFFDMPRGSFRIRQARRRLGLSQLQVATKADVSPRTYQFAEGGKTEVSRQSLLKIANSLGISLEEAMLVDDAVAQDHFNYLPWSMSGFLQKKLALGNENFCHDEVTAESIIRKIRESWKQHLDSLPPNTNDPVCRTADQKLDQEVEKVVDRYLSIWNRNPATLQVATVSDEACGASIVLPVTDSAFNRLCRGEISFQDIVADDILEESQNLVLDSAVEFAGTGNPGWSQFTSSLSYVLFCQIASLSIAPTADNFRMASFSASPLNEKRLRTIGFQSNGFVMPHFGYPIFTFSVRESEAFKDTYEASSTTVHYTHLLRNANGDSSMMRQKRKVITHALSLLKRALGDAAKRLTRTRPSVSA